MADPGDEPEVAGGVGVASWDGGGGGRRPTWPTWQPFRTPRDPSPFGRPPALSRPSAEKLLFYSWTESGSVSPLGASQETLPRPANPATAAVRGPSAARESAVAAGKGCRPPPAALSCALDDTAPASTPRAGKGGGWEAGRWIRGEGPGGTGSQGAEWKSKAYAVAGGAPTEIENSKRGPTGPTGLAGPAQASSPARAAWTEGK